MRRGQYTDAGINQLTAAQMQHMSAQRSQHNSGKGNYPGYADSVHADEERQYMSSRAEGQWQWDRDGQKGSLSSHMYAEGLGGDAPRSLYQSQRSDSKSSLEKYGNKEARAQAKEEDMEIGYEDPVLPQTFESLEQKFFQDIMQLTKEHQDAEDKENTRHREKLNEINTQYQNRLVAIRAQQATHRDDFLRKESHARHQQYQQASMKIYQNSAGPSDGHGYGSAGGGGGRGRGGLGEVSRGYAVGHYDNYGEQPEFARNARGHGIEQRGQYPGGRAYNSGGRYY